MATGVVMPALEMTQETGRLVAWLKREGEPVNKGEPLMEVETDKVTIEIEAPDSGILGGVLIRENDVVPVGQTIAWIHAPGEKVPAAAPLDMQSGRASTLVTKNEIKEQPPLKKASVEISPVARRIAEEYGIDLATLSSNGRRIEKADVLGYLESTRETRAVAVSVSKNLTPASPKARRIASERGIDVTQLKGSGPAGAVLADDIPFDGTALNMGGNLETPGTVWRVMAERMTASWTTVPHFYLIREVEATNLITWRSSILSKVEKQFGIRPTYTDLLVKLIGFALRHHPRVNASWSDGQILYNDAINAGLAVAIDDGLIVPVIRDADSSSVGEIAKRRRDIVERAQTRKLRPADISGGTFTLSNLGMYNVDVFNAILNTPQAAILAVGRIAERVVAVNGQPAVRSMMIVSLSCDHRVVDGAHAARFLDELAGLIENPLGMLS